MDNAKTNGLSKTNLRLVESAILLALSTVLSLVKVWELPLGGSVTLCSMLPILLLGYKYGVRWGLLTGFTYGVIQLLLDLAKAFSWGLTPTALAASFVFDYLLAFACLGLAGAFGKSFPKFLGGMFFAVFLRFVMHVVSGVTAYASWLPPEWQGHLFLYSLAYNGSYLLPDFAVCLVVGALLYRPLKRFL